MIPATTIAKLASLGLTAGQTATVAELLAEVEAATEGKAAAAIEARRAADRERQAKRRSGVSRDTADIQDADPAKEAPQTPKENNYTHDTTRERTPEELDRIAVACREAAGAESNPAPALFDLSPILAWLDEGYSLAEEILPVIRRRRPAVASRLRSWSYFTDAFREAREARDRFVSAAREAARTPRPEGGGGRPRFDTRDPITKALLAMDEEGRLHD